jgi:hypothetical protein
MVAATGAAHAWAVLSWGHRRSCAVLTGGCSSVQQMGCRVSWVVCDCVCMYYRRHCCCTSADKGRIELATSLLEGVCARGCWSECVCVSVCWGKGSKVAVKRPCVLSCAALGAVQGLMQPRLGWMDGSEQWRPDMRSLHCVGPCVLCGASRPSVLCACLPAAVAQVDRLGCHCMTCVCSSLGVFCDTPASLTLTCLSRLTCCPLLTL